MSSLYLRGKELCSTSLRAEYLQKLFGILLCERFMYTYLCIQSFIYISMESWIFILYFELLSNNTLFILLLKLFCFDHQELLCLFDISPVVCLLSRKYLAQEDRAGLPCIFPAQTLESAIFPRSTGSFNWRMYLKP